LHINYGLQKASKQLHHAKESVDAKAEVTLRFK